MPNYRRDDTPGAIYFFTVVSYRRRPLLCDDTVRAALREAVNAVKDRHSFVIDAWVLLPDHLHCIWTLPENDHAYSMRWSIIKRLVTQAVGARGAPYGLSREEIAGPPRKHSNQSRCGGGAGPVVSQSRLKRREGCIWQRRFWEHRIRNQVDLNRCLDYLHWNPVKHGHVRRVVDWPYSTFHRYAGQGMYPEDWGGEGVVEGGAFGE